MKNTTKTKAEPASEQIQALIDNGIKVKKAVFHPTILSYGASKNGDPETALFSDSPKASKLANMWLTPGILVIEQKGRFKAVPLAHVTDIDFL